MSRLRSQQRGSFGHSSTGAVFSLAPAPLLGGDDVIVTEVASSPPKLEVEFIGNLGLAPRVLMTAQTSTLQQAASGSQPAGITFAISAISQIGNQVTATVAPGHGIKAGAIFCVSGVPIAGYNGNNFLVVGVTATTVVYNVTPTALAPSAGGIITKVLNIEMSRVGILGVQNAKMTLELLTKDFGNASYFKLTFEGQTTGAIQVSDNSGFNFQAGERAGRVTIQLCALSNVASNENTSMLNAWIATVPNGATAMLRPGVIYWHDWSVVWSAKVGVTFDLNGSTLKTRASVAGYDATGHGTRKQMRIAQCTDFVCRNGTIVGSSDGSYHQDAEQEACIQVSDGFDTHITQMNLGFNTGDAVQAAGSTTLTFVQGLEVSACQIRKWGRMAFSTAGNLFGCNIHHNEFFGPSGRSLIDIEQVNGLLVTDGFKYTDNVDDVIRFSGEELLNWMAMGGAGKVYRVTIARNTTRIVHVQSGTGGIRFFELLTNGVGTFQLKIFDERQQFGYSGFTAGSSFKFTLGAFESTTAVVWNADLNVVRDLVDQASKEVVAAFLGIPEASVETERDNWTVNGGDLYVKEPTLVDIPQMTMSSLVNVVVNFARTFVHGGETTTPLSAVNATAAQVNSAIIALYKYAPPNNLVEQSDVIVTGGPLPAPIYVDLGTQHLDTEVPMMGKVEAGGCVLTIGRYARFDYTIEDNVGLVPWHAGIISLVGQKTARVRNNTQAYDGGQVLQATYEDSSQVDQEINPEDGLAYERNNSWN